MKIMLKVLLVCGSLISYMWFVNLFSIFIASVFNPKYDFSWGVGRVFGPWAALCGFSIMLLLGILANAAIYYLDKNPKKTFKLLLFGSFSTILVNIVSFPNAMGQYHNSLDFWSTMGLILLVIYLCSTILVVINSRKS